MLNTRLSKRRERLRSLRGRILVAAGNKEVGVEQIMVTKEGVVVTGLVDIAMEARL